MWLPAAPGCQEFYYYVKDLNYDYEVVQPDHLEYLDMYAAYAEMERLFLED